MTTTQELAAQLDTTEDNIIALANQIADDPTMWDEDTNRLTALGVEAVSANFPTGRAVSIAGDLLADAEAAAEAAETARQALDAARDRRDAAIREALAAGVTYSALGLATGMSRSALDTIRTGRRGRR